MMLGGPKPAPGAAADEPRDDRTGEVHRITRPDGSELRVECYGPADAPPIVMTHGWGCDSTEWFYPKKHLAGRFRLILWDEPGLGLSKKPDNNDYRLEKLAADLEAVLAFAGDRPAVLVGHSIGGMITLTFCKLFPESLGRRVAGLVLAHTSYTNPVRTTKMAALYTAIEKPVIIPLLHLTIGALAARLGDELAELPQRLGAPVDAQAVVRRDRDARPARFLCPVHATRPSRRPGPGDAGDDRLRRHGDPADDPRPHPGRRRRPGHHDPPRSRPVHQPRACPTPGSRRSRRPSTLA